MTALPLFHRTDEGQYGLEVELEPALSAGDVLEEARSGLPKFEDWLFQRRSGGGSHRSVGGGRRPTEGNRRQ